MSVDDVADADIRLLLAVTDGSGAAFPDDTLPPDYPLTGTPPDYPHTFSLKDASGTVLFQFQRFEQQPQNLCGDSDGSGKINAADALIALRAAVSLQACADCVCDVVSRDGVLANDALKILIFAVGGDVLLDCPAC